MIYFGMALLFVIYLEMLGRAFLSFIKKDLFLFAFPIGFAVLFCSCYVFTSVLTALNCSFNLLLFIDILIVGLSLLLIAKQIKQIDYHFDFIHILLLCGMGIVLLFYSWNTTLGELHGFDSTHYLNMVSSNIGLEKLNTSNVMYGTYTEQAYSYQYTFQSYFYFLSSMFYIISGLLSKLGITFFVPTAFIWVFQIVFDFLFCGLVLIGLKKYFKRNYLIYALIIVLMVFGYGKLYFNNVYGFYGNTLRTVVTSYSIYFFVEYFKSKNRKDLVLSMIFVLSACALSSTAVFSIFFYLFGIFFVLVDEEKELFKIYSLVLFFPFINLVTVLTSDVFIGIIVALVASLILWFGNNLFINVFEIKRNRKTLLFICFATMFFASYLVTRNIFDFSALFDNLSENHDMTLDYFDLPDRLTITRIYKYVSIIPLFILMFLKRKDKFIEYSWILILVLFNPFCCPILNEYNVVYYRSYELILNPFTIVYMFSLIESSINKKIYFNIIFSFLFALVLYEVDYKTPNYYHKDYVPSENYNELYKMKDDEIDIIFKLNEDIKYKQINSPKIVTTNILTQSYIPEGIYYFGRGNQIDKNWSHDEYQLYAMFWPVIHYGDDRQPNDVDYCNMCEYIKNSGVDYIVQDKNIEYLNKESGTWYSMVYKINECGIYPFYENNTYSLYYFN